MNTTRRSFLRKSALGVGGFALAPTFNSLLANTVQDGVKGVTPSVLGGAPRRFIFIRKSSGLRPHEIALPSFTKKQAKLDKKKQALEVDLRDHELPEWMRTLESYKSNMSILQGLSSKMSDNGHWSGASVMGAFKAGQSISGIKRATIDYELAKLYPSPFGHIELALRGSYTNFETGIQPGLSAPGPQQRNYCYTDPMTAYQELFKSVLDPTAVKSGNTMLNFLENEEKLKAAQVEGYEKLKLSNHIHSIEEIEARNQRLQSVSGKIEQFMPEIDPIHADGGVNATTMQKQKAMTDVLVAALAARLTNVVTYTIDVLATPVTGLPGNETDNISIHNVGHSGSYSGISAGQIREKIRIAHLDQVKTIADKLKAIPEGDGTMFDHTMIMYFPEGGETHHGIGTEAPFVVLAGDKCAVDMLGRYIRLPYHATEGHKTLGNWYTTLLNAHGNPIDHYGDFDLDMSRLKLDQVGPIRQFL